MRMKRKTASLLITAVFVTILLTAAAYWYLEFSTIYDVIELGMDVYVGSNPGINVDVDAVHFGKVPPGASGGREMNVTAGNYPTIVSFEHYGKIAEWTSVTDNNFFLEPNETKSVFVQISIPDDIVPLVYRNGTLRIIFRKALF